MIKLVIVTHVPHLFENGRFYAYGPYVHEMNIWSKFVDELVIVAPVVKAEITKIDSFYTQNKIRLLPIPSFDVLSFNGFFLMLLKFPKLFFVMFKGMQTADHIHLRCPGNVGLLGCLVQIFFPSKTKTAKYAGNWNPEAKQPWSYRLQKWILSNTFLTRNMQVLVYGEWENQTKNVKPFFTASYYEKEKEDLGDKNLESKITFIFAGALVKGKNPMYAIRLVEGLLNKGLNVGLDLYGEGIERNKIETYILENNLREVISLKGNQQREVLKKAYQESHFVVLPSKSEGWPKAIAEGMFWGCVPIATAVSCVPYMLDFGKRGVLLQMNLDVDTDQIINLILDKGCFNNKQQIAFIWSQQYTLDFFERQIKILID